MGSTSRVGEQETRGKIVGPNNVAQASPLGRGTGGGDIPSAIPWDARNLAGIGISSAEGVSLCNDTTNSSAIHDICERRPRPRPTVGDHRDVVPHAVQTRTLDAFQRPKILARGKPSCAEGTSRGQDVGDIGISWKMSHGKGIDRASIRVKTLGCEITNRIIIGRSNVRI